MRSMCHTWEKQLELLLVEDGQALHHVGGLGQAEELHVGGTVEERAQPVLRTLHKRTKTASARGCERFDDETLMMRRSCACVTS